MTEEDRRAAVAISVNLSTQLIAAALALLAVEGAYISYALADRTPSVIFIPACALSVVLLIISIFIAGKGITAARNAGYEGRWDLAVGKRHFNKQAAFCLLALLSFGVALLCSGPSQEDSMKEKVMEMQSSLLGIQSRVISLADGHTSHDKALSEIRGDLSNMASSLEELSKGKTSN